jgi:O-antigen ligase/tetratricopeptide (TPR) repeat protein
LVFAALFLCLGLAFSPALQQQFTLPKLFCLRLSATAVGLLWWWRLRASGVKTIPAVVLVPAALLIAWWIVTLPFAIHTPTALWGMPGRYNGFINQLTLLLMFLAVASMRLRREEVTRLVITFVVALVPLALYAVAQGAGVDRFAWPNPRPGSTIGHPVPLAAILSLGLPFALALAMTGATKATGGVWLGMAALLLFAIGITLSRGPWAGAAVAVVIVLLAAVLIRRMRPARTWLLIAAFAIAAAATVWAGRVPGTRVSQRVTQLTRLWTDPSFMNRFVFFRAASAMMRDYPVTGVGFESFALLYPRYRPVEGEAVPEDSVPSMVHNGYLQLAVTTGVPGLVLYLLLMAGVLTVLVRTLRTPPTLALGADRGHLIAAAFIAAVTGYLVQDLSGWPEISLSAFFWTIAGLAVSYSTGRSEESRTIAASGRSLLGGLALMASLATGVLAYISFQEIRADRALATVSRLDVSKNWPQIAAGLDTALAIAGNDAHYIHEAGILYLERLRTSGGRQTYENGVALIARAQSLNAFDPYTLIHRLDLDTAALQARIVQTPSSSAIAAAALAVDMDPNNASVHESVARFQLLAGRAPEALVAIETARALRPGRAGYRLLEGDILRAVGEPARAVEAYRSEAAMHRDADSVWVVAEHKWIAALADSGDYRAAAAAGEAFATRMPGDVTGHVLLGIAYVGLRDGRRGKAAFAAALAIDPDNRSARDGTVESDRLIAGGEEGRQGSVVGLPSPVTGRR